MTIFYGVILFVGFAMLVLWLVLAAVASGVEGWSERDPERTFGSKGRSVVAGTVGFGMGGISMLYTELPEALSVAAGVVGALAMVAVSRWLGPVDPS